MALIDKVLNKKEDPSVLTKEEIEFLLGLIQRSTFQGESIEPLYKLIGKLQAQYLSLKDKD